jgi:hypothetical protein
MSDAERNPRLYGFLSALAAENKTIARICGKNHSSAAFYILTIPRFGYNSISKIGPSVIKAQQSG